MANPSKDLKHGTPQTWRQGCRCLPCRQAISQYVIAGRKAREAHDWDAMVSATPARKHLLRLARVGIGHVMAADAAKVSVATVREIRSSRQRRARASTVERICAVTIAARGDGVHVSAAHSLRLIQELQEEGYTQSKLATLLDRKWPALQLGTERVRLSTEARIVRLHRKLTT